MKKKAKTNRKNAVITKAKAFLSRKKTKKASTTRKKTSSGLADSIYIHSSSDPAHSPGHRTMNLKENARVEKKGPKSTMTRADKIKRTSATNRRVITGAALGKTGQLVFK